MKRSTIQGLMLGWQQVCSCSLPDVEAEPPPTRPSAIGQSTDAAQEAVAGATATNAGPA